MAGLFYRDLCLSQRKKPTKNSCEALGLDSSGASFLLIKRKVTMALEAIDVKLHDHIIVGDDYYSMSEHGLIKNMTDQFNQFLSGRDDWTGKGGRHAQTTQ